MKFYVKITIQLTSDKKVKVKLQFPYFYGYIYLKSFSYQYKQWLLAFLKTDRDLNTNDIIFNFLTILHFIWLLKII